MFILKKILTIYENILNNDLDTKRKGIKKINQLNTHEFLNFLRQLLALFENNELNLNKITITEKIDGSAIRLIMLNNNLLFESSTSGVTTWDNVPFKNITKFLKNHLEHSFQKISKLLNADFKIIGELISVENSIENGKITPVGASYLANKFGTKGGIVIFEVKKILDNKLVDFSETEEKILLNELKKLNDKEFVFYDKSDIILKNIKFNLDIKNLKYLLSLPEYNKVRYSSIKDKAILNSIEEIRTNITNQLENIINSTQGNFSALGDLIEGIVLKINDSGEQYGIFSNGYKELKKRYFKYTEQREQLTSEFFKNIFGYSMLSSIKKNLDINKRDIYKNNFNKFYLPFLEEYKQCFKNLINDKTIPLGTKNIQIEMFKQRLNSFEKLNTFEKLEQFIQEKVFKK